MKTITIDPVTRIEGHAKITIRLDDAGKVAGTELHVTQIRGFEEFTKGRPYYEMPGITARICGICPVSHLLASAKACDAIMAVRIPPAGRLLRELVHYGQFVQSHALSFFYLSAPDLLLGMDADPATRNVMGLIHEHPELARDGIDLRKFGQQIIEAIAGERIHGSGIVPGGIAQRFTEQARDRILADLPMAKAIAKRTIDFFKGAIDNYRAEIEHFGSAPLMSAGLVDAAGNLQLYDGRLRFRGSDGTLAADGIEAEDYARWIGEASLPESYMKAPFFVPKGFPDGVYRVGPLARLNVGDCGTERADAELREFRDRFGWPAEGAFLNHYARLIEIVFALERIEALLPDPRILDEHVRATAGVNAHEGVGMIEAPRGVLIHQYHVDDHGGMTKANLIVATGHNTLAMGRSIQEVSEHFIDGTKLTEGMLNRVSAVVRAYDPCLSCSTHALGAIPVRVRLVDPDGALLDELAWP
ncbi:MAG TPA: Ni/Fe hydrogenase subunit alpha [Thermoanaerobaculia bacterium]